jgi:hypothetical protein
MKSQIDRWLEMVSTWDNGQLIDVYFGAGHELSRMTAGPGSWDVEEVSRQQKYVNFLKSQVVQRGIRL